MKPEFSSAVKPVAANAGRPGPRVRGFTLIELMVTVSVIAILAGIGVPAFLDTILAAKLNSYANSFVASTALARSEAIKRNATVTLCASANGTACASSGGWQQGWIVLAGTTVVQYQQALSSGYHFTETGAGLHSLAFQSIGVGATSASMKVCRATPSAGGQERVVTLSATGRASVSTTKTGSCS